MTKYIVTTPAGDKYTRTSDRTYTHAAFILADGHFTFCGMSSSMELAQKNAKRSISWGISAAKQDARAVRHSNPQRYAEIMEAIKQAEIRISTWTPVVIKVEVAA